MEVDVEAIPILKAQVEVYQSDFNAERAAREKIAGEKADLEEEVRRIRQRQQQIADDIEAIPVRRLTCRHTSLINKCDKFEKGAGIPLFARYSRSLSTNYKVPKLLYFLKCTGFGSSLTPMLRELSPRPGREITQPRNRDLPNCLLESPSPTPQPKYSFQGSAKRAIRAADACGPLRRKKPSEPDR